MARMGMDVDQVASAGKALKERAAEIDALVGKLDGIVRSIPGVWEGPDAKQFVNEWWPEHKKTLVAASSHVAGLGQSALNNASEQRDVSGANGGGGGGLPFGMTVPTIDPVTVPSDTGGGAAAFPAWAAGAVGRPIDVDKAYGNQCVDVINDYADTLYPGVSHSTSLGGGNAKDIFASTSDQYFDKVASSGTPQPGDIICIGANQYSDNGHVAVVESVGPNGQVNVIQQNGANPTGSTYRGTVSAVEMKAVQGYLRPKG